MKIDHLTKIRRIPFHLCQPRVYIVLILYQMQNSQSTVDDRWTVTEYAFMDEMRYF